MDAAAAREDGARDKGEAEDGGDGEADDDGERELDDEVREVRERELKDSAIMLNSYCFGGS